MIHLDFKFARSIWGSLTLVGSWARGIIDLVCFEVLTLEVCLIVDVFSLPIGGCCERLPAVYGHEVLYMMLVFAWAIQKHIDLSTWQCEWGTGTYVKVGWMGTGSWLKTSFDSTDVTKRMTDETKFLRKISNYVVHLRDFGFSGLHQTWILEGPCNVQHSVFYIQSYVSFQSNSWYSNYQSQR